MIKKLAVAVVAAGALFAATAPAHAAGHVSLSLGVGLPVGGYYGPAAPAYYGPPAPAYYGPPAAVVYDAPVVYGAPAYPGYYYGPRYYGPRAYVRVGPYWHGGGWRDHGYRR